MNARQRPANKRPHIGFNFVHQDGLRYGCTASRGPDGNLLEIFLTCSKAGSTAQQNADAAAILCSLLLQHGIDAEIIKHAVAGSPVATAIELAEVPE